MTDYSQHPKHQTRTVLDITVPVASTSELPSPLLLPTPNASLVDKGGLQHPDKRKRGGTK